jgi:hypothetical protein
MGRSVSVSNPRAAAMRCSVIHSPTVRPVRRRTTVVRVPRGHAQFACHITQPQRLGVTPVDHLEHLGQQRFATAPQLGDHRSGQPREIDQQQRQLRERRLAITVLPREQFRFDRTDRGVPRRPSGRGHVQPQYPAGVPVQEREQQRVRPPRRPRRSPVLAQRGGVEEQRNTGVAVLQPLGVEHLTRGRHVDQPGRGKVPKRRKVVDVATAFDEILGAGPHHRHGRRVRIAPVLIDRYPRALPNHPSGSRHTAKNSPTFAEDHPIAIQSRGSPWTM